MNYFCAAVLEFESGPVSDRLEEAIRVLAERTGVTALVPHLTVIGEFSLETGKVDGVLRQLTRGFTPFEVELVSTSNGDTWTRAAYLDARAPELGALRARAANVLGLAPGLYVPHVSLLYGSQPSTIRQALVADLRLELPMTVTVNRLTMWDIKSTAFEDLPNYETIGSRFLAIDRQQGHDGAGNGPLLGG